LPATDAHGTTERREIAMEVRYYEGEAGHLHLMDRLVAVASKSVDLVPEVFPLMMESVC
jgi:hypothetical protein